MLFGGGKRKDDRRVVSIEACVMNESLLLILASKELFVFPDWDCNLTLIC